MHNLRTPKASFFLTVLFILLAILVAYAAEHLHNTIPASLVAAVTFIILTLARSVLFAMLGQNLTIDKSLSERNGVKHVVLRNGDYQNILEVKVFFEIYERASEESAFDESVLLHAENIALSSIQAARSGSEKKEYELWLALPEKTVAAWEVSKSDKGYVYMMIGVTSVHYLTGYRDLKKRELIF